MENKHLSAPCGLYCGICPKYEDKTCEGCHSDFHFCDHKGCNIYKCCVNEKKFNWCFECEEFPCVEIKNFTKWRSWISHKDCIKNLNRMKEIDIKEWLKEQNDLNK